MRLLVLGLFFAVSLPAMATTFHVDPVNGSDAGDGSIADPWRSLQTVLDSGLVETRNWPSYPYQTGMSLVTVHAGAPVRAGDTILLGNGYHGDLVIEHAYNTAAITIANESGQMPQIRSITVRAAQHWILRGLRVSPSFAQPNTQLTMVRIANHNYFGPAWDIEFADSELFSVADASAWTASEWIKLASNGIDVGADRVSVHGNTVRNVRFGISVGGAQASIRHNRVDGFSADGLRGLGDFGLFEYNRVQNVKIGSQSDANHDDGFQSWSVGSSGVGSGEVVGVVLRGNVFINSTDPDDPLRGSMQGIGCFDGFFRDWVVENNVVITDHWHGISFYGMTDSRIINNTVIDMNNVSPGPPWIMVHAHKDGRPSANVIVRNNLATDFSLDGDVLVIDHNLEMSDPGSILVAPPYDVHLLATSAAIDNGSSTLAPAIDIDGVARPQGAGFDLGAYEWRADFLFSDGFEVNRQRAALGSWSSTQYESYDLP